VREESRQKSHENDLYWLFWLTPEMDELVAQLHASRKMVEKYDQLRAQNKISPDEAICSATRREPVKATLEVDGWVARAAPTRGPSAVKQLTSPAGSPDRSARCCGSIGWRPS